MRKLLPILPTAPPPILQPRHPYLVVSDLPARPRHRVSKDKTEEIKCSFAWHKRISTALNRQSIKRSSVRSGRIS